MQASPCRPAATLSLLIVLVGVLHASPVSSQQASLAAAERLIENGRYPEARTMLVTLTRRQPEDARIAALTGRTYFVLQDGDSAVNHLERAVRLDPRSGGYQLWLGEAYGLQLDSANRLRQRAIAERMQRAFERAIELDPRLEGGYIRLIQYHIQAPRSAGGDLDRAREYATVLARVNPHTGLLMLANVEQATGDSVAAERTYARAVTAFPDSIVPRVALVASQMERGRFVEAWAQLQPLTEADPVQTWVLFMVGRWSALTGRELDRGERALREYLQRRPTRPEEGSLPGAHVRLGQVLQHRGDVAGARREFEAALRLDPQFQPARDALRALR